MPQDRTLFTKHRALIEGVRGNPAPGKMAYLGPHNNLTTNGRRSKSGFRPLCVGVFASGRDEKGLVMVIPKFGYRRYV
jgi:hypothetical protein